MPFKIFISYSTKDLDKANQVKQRLGSYAGRSDRVITAMGLPYTKIDAPCFVF